MAQEHALARRFAAAVLIALAAVQASHSSYGKGSFTDNRDGKTYKFVKIGTLISYAGGEEIAGRKLKAKKDWISDRGIGTDDYGFSALPGGKYVPVTGNKFYGSDKNAMEGFLAMNMLFGIWWSTSESEYPERGAYDRGMSSGSAYVGREYGSIVYGNKTDGYSVRCLKD
jgi:uncharacterized protein (TIGR02145 family)